MSRPGRLHALAVGLGAFWVSRSARLAQVEDDAVADEKLQQNFSAGHFLVYPQRHSRWAGLRDAASGKEDLFAGMEVGMQDVTAQMETWAESGELGKALSTAQISPKYKGSLLETEIGFLVDWTACSETLVACPYKLLMDYARLAKEGDDRNQAINDAVRDFEQRIIETMKKPMAPKLHLAVPMPASTMNEYWEAHHGKPAWLDHHDLIQHSKAVLRIEKALESDVVKALMNKDARNRWQTEGSGTEVVASCPVTAFAGVVVTLPTLTQYPGKLAGRYTKADLVDLARVFLERLGSEVPDLVGRRMPIVKYAPGGGISDVCASRVNDQCHYDADAAYSELDDATMHVEEWVTVRSGAA